jgi:hypothetical protein
MAYGICILCFGDTRKRKRYCERCSKLCVRCREQPKEGAQQYCKSCRADKNAYMRSLMRGTDAYRRHMMQNAINRQIRRGYIDRDACRVPGCGKAPGRVYVVDIDKGSFTFLCQEHSDLATDRYGRAERKADSAKIRRNLHREIALGQLESFYRNGSSVRAGRAHGKVANAGCHLAGRSKARANGLDHGA